MKEFNWNGFKKPTVVSVATEEEALDFAQKVGLNTDTVLKQFYSADFQKTDTLVPAFSEKGMGSKQWYKDRGFDVVPWSDYMPLCINLSQTKDFIGRMLSFGYGYDEALQFGVLAHDMYQKRGQEIDIPQEYIDFIITEEATSYIRKFFDACEKDEDDQSVFYYFVKTFF